MDSTPNTDPAEQFAAPPWEQAMFAPRSVALYGASNQADKTSARPLQFLRAGGWKGDIYPINAGRETVLGHRAWPSLLALPAVPDHVFVLTGADGALSAVRDAVQLGVPMVTVMSDGFAEAGAVGVARQAELSAQIAGSRTRVLGPSSLGLSHLGSGLTLTANAAFAEADLPRGDVFVASQSGSLMGALLTRGRAVGIGFAGFVSMGGEMDLSLGEVCSATLDDPDVGSYALFLESLRHVQDLRRFAAEAAARGKPVVAYKLGRSQAAAELSVSHTGALSGDDVVASAVLSAAGIARVENFEALLEAQALAKSARPGMARAAPGDRPRIGLVSTTGGGGAMLVDQLEVRGLRAQPPSAETRRRLADVGHFAGESPLIDLTLAGANYQVMRQVLEVVLQAEEFDAVVAVAGSSARYHPELTVKPVIDSDRTSTPLAAFIVPDAPEALRMLHQADIPAFRTPESCADAMAAVLGRRSDLPMFESVTTATGPGEILDEAQSYAVLSALGVPVIEHRIVPVPSVGDAVPFPGQMVVKALSHQLPHKSDAGGVLPAVTAETLPDALQSVVDAVSERAGIQLDRCLVSPMVSGLAEVLVGYRVDPEAGPLVVLGSGGVLAELYGDRSVRCAPVDLHEARSMISEVQALQAVAGYRGGEQGDLEALAAVIVAMSQASTWTTPIWEAEVNPLMILPRGKGVVAVDALVVLGGTQT